MCMYIHCCSCCSFCPYHCWSHGNNVYLRLYLMLIRYDMHMYMYMYIYCGPCCSFCRWHCWSHEHNVYLRLYLMLTRYDMHIYMYMYICCCACCSFCRCHCWSHEHKQTKNSPEDARWQAQHQVRSRVYLFAYVYLRWICISSQCVLVYICMHMCI